MKISRIKLTGKIFHKDIVNLSYFFIFLKNK